MAKSPHLLPTFALPTRDMRRFKFGFRLKAKSEHEAALVRRWYGAYLDETPICGRWKTHRSGGAVHRVRATDRGLVVNIRGGYAVSSKIATFAQRKG